MAHWKIEISGEGSFLTESGESIPALGAMLVDKLKDYTDIHAATFTHGAHGHDILDAEKFVAVEKSKADAQAAELAKTAPVAPVPVPDPVVMPVAAPADVEPDPNPAT